jgi:nicotinate-nucleotide adenylyltransferase
LRRIGIYGGTFDPVHYAHLILAREAIELLELEKLVFVPAALSPHKQDRPPTPPNIRVAMLQAGLAGEQRFTVDELELRRPPPSFTIDTIEEFRRANPDAEIFLCIGSDNLPRLHTWHRFEELRELVRFVVLDRGAAALNGDYEVVRRPVDISSTEVRNRVATGQPIRYLVPPAVEEIIRREQLYQEPTRSLPKS